MPLAEVQLCCSPARRDATGERLWARVCGACAAMPGTMEIGVQGMGVGPASAERAVVPVVPPG